MPATCHHAPALNSKVTVILVYRILQAFTRLELRLVRGFNLNRFTGARIATGRGLAMGDTKGAEPDQADFFFFGKSARDRFENAINSFGCIGLGHFRTIGYGGNKVIFIQDKTPLLFESKRKSQCLGRSISAPP